MGIAILICLVLASIAALVVIERVRKENKPERPDASALDYLNTFISTLYMVLLALIVVVQWQNVDQINTDARSETTTLTALVCFSFWFVLDLDTLFHGVIHADSAPFEQFLAAPGTN